MPRTAHLIKVVQLFQWRHPETGMGIELVIQPRRTGFLRADTKKIWPRIAFELTSCGIAGEAPFIRPDELHYRCYPDSAEEKQESSEANRAHNSLDLRKET